jgi:hypothetical protein
MGEITAVILRKSEKAILIGDGQWVPITTVLNLEDIDLKSTQPQKFNIKSWKYDQLDIQEIGRVVTAIEKQNATGGPNIVSFDTKPKPKPKVKPAFEYKQESSFINHLKMSIPKLIEQQGIYRLAGDGVMVGHMDNIVQRSRIIQNQSEIIVALGQTNGYLLGIMTKLEKLLEKLLGDKK